MPTGAQLGCRGRYRADSAGFAAPAQAQIYSWRDANGQPGPVQHAAGTGAADVRLYAVPKAEAVRATRAYVASDRAAPTTTSSTSTARRNGVRPDLVRAVMQVESAFNPFARSPKGRHGPDAADAGDRAASTACRNPSTRPRTSAAASPTCASCSTAIEQRGARAGRLQRRPRRGRQVRPERSALPRDAELRRADQPDARHADHAMRETTRSTRSPKSIDGRDRPLHRQEADHRHRRRRQQYAGLSLPDAKLATPPAPPPARPAARRAGPSASVAEQHLDRDDRGSRRPRPAPARPGRRTARSANQTMPPAIAPGSAMTISSSHVPPSMMSRCPIASRPRGALTAERHPGRETCSATALWIVQLREHQRRREDRDRDAAPTSARPNPTRRQDRARQRARPRASPTRSR